MIPNRFYLHSRNVVAFQNGARRQSAPKTTKPILDYLFIYMYDSSISRRDEPFPRRNRVSVRNDKGVRVRRNVLEALRKHERERSLGPMASHGPTTLRLWVDIIPNMFMPFVTLPSRPLRFTIKLPDIYAL